MQAGGEGELLVFTGNPIFCKAAVSESESDKGPEWLPERDSQRPVRMAS